MNDHIDDLLPFYINQTLDEADIALVHAHLNRCAVCRTELETWESIARGVTDGEAPARPQLSPLVLASLDRRPSLSQAAASAVHLIWSQRVLITRTWLLPSLGSFTILGSLAAILMKDLAATWMDIPLFAMMPIAAALSTAFLYTLEDDPANELVATTPTSLATLLFARLTLALGVISLMGFAGSFAVALTGQPLFELTGMIGIWLAPMLLLSSLTTVLSLCLHPRIASGAALMLWGSLLILLLAERAGSPILRMSLLWLVQPGWALFTGQVLLAGLLWLGVWFWLSSNPSAPLHPEGRL